jgi:multicomponent Na+:H+ antiporter subunit D
MNPLLILPLLIPFVSGVINLLLWRRIRPQRVLSLLGMGLLLLVSLLLFRSVWQNGVMAAQMGNWPAPWGITLVADLFSAIMVVLAATVGLAVTIFSIVNIDRQRVAFGYYPLVNLLLMGICGAFLTGDMFNLYVWFEVLLIASFVLLGLGGEAAQLQGTVKYVVINIISSTIFLSALGMLYGLVGTLNMADVYRQFQVIAPEERGVITVLAMLFLVAFGIKAALFPLYFWLPASYHTPPTAVSAIFAGLLTKVGVYALIRVFSLLFIGNTDYLGTLLLFAAGFTMLSGVLGAMSQMDIRRVLSFHIISQIGYMVMGLGLYVYGGSVLGLTGAIFYIIHHIIVKTNLFLVAGVIGRLRGTFDLRKLGGLLHTQPILSLLFLISAMSLAGLPPLSGFWAKFTLVRAGLEGERYGIVAVSLLVSLLTLYSMTKIWSYAFWNAAPAESGSPVVSIQRERLLYIFPVVLLALVTVVIGFSAETIFRIASEAATQLSDPTAYLNAVLGNS